MKLTLQITEMETRHRLALMSDSHVSEHFCQIKIFHGLVKKNTIICLFGV